MTDAELSHLIMRHLESRNIIQDTVDGRDAVHEPEMTLMLLEKLLRNNMRVHFSEHSLSIFNWNGYESAEQFKITDFNLGRAVAEAFAKANGLEPVQGDK